MKTRVDGRCSCGASGASEIILALRKELERRGLSAGHIDVHPSRCLDRCQDGPILLGFTGSVAESVTPPRELDEKLLRRPKVCFEHVSVDQIPAIVDRLLRTQLMNRSTHRRRSPMLELVLFLAVVSSTFQYCRAQQDTSRALSLREGVQLVLSQNPNVQIAMLNSSLAKQEQHRALAALLPHASVSASEAIDRTNNQSTTGANGYLPQHEGPFQVITAGTQFNATVFNAALVEHYRAEQSAHAASLADAKAVREQMVQLVVNQYLLCLRLNSTVSSDEAQVALAQRLFDQATHLEDAGAGTGLDTLRANQKLKTEQQALLVAREEAQTALYELVHLLNLPPATTLTLSDSEEYVNHSFARQEETIEAAYAQRPEMIALRGRVEAAKRDLASARGERLPSISLSGTWNEQGNRPDNLIPTYQYQAGLSIPLFTGGRIRSEVTSSTLRIDQLKQEEQELRNRIAQDVKTATARLDAALQEVKVADDGLNLAKEEVTQARDRFEAGASDNIEVVTAQDTLARAYDDQISALFKVNQAKADLARSVGHIEITYEK
jgi:outer membrane protein TolC/(2Fe-2S) ferredoxin